MKRISLTIPKKLLDRLDLHVGHFVGGKLAGNRAKYICSLIEKYCPTLDEED